MSYKDYSAGDTGADTERGIGSHATWDTDKHPQRGTRPKLDLSCEGDDFYTKLPFSQKANASSCMEDFDDVSAIDNNHPVPQRKGWKEFEHGWQIEPSEALGSGESGAFNADGKMSKPR